MTEDEIKVLLKKFKISSITKARFKELEAKLTIWFINQRDQKLVVSFRMF